MSLALPIVFLLELGQARVVLQIFGQRDPRHRETVVVDAPAASVVGLVARAAVALADSEATVAVAHTAVAHAASVATVDVVDASVADGVVVAAPVATVFAANAAVANDSVAAAAVANVVVGPAGVAPSRPERC